MGETPSNYNIANGRLEGQSQGLKLLSKITQSNLLSASLPMSHQQFVNGLLK